jgi:acyl-CoA synthetase (NDP forming)
VTDTATNDRAQRRANLRRGLTARSIAFIGGSGVEHGIQYCRDLGFTGRLYAVNPKRPSIAGVPCVPSVRDLPEPPECSFIAVNPEIAIDAVADLAAIGAPSAVMYTAGFAESGDHDLQRRLREAAGATLALVGPNCIGTINYFDAVPVAIGNHGVERPAKGVAVIAQSGTITINLVGADRSLPIGYLLSIGNQAVLGMADYVDVVLDDPRVTGLVLYVEGLDDAQAFAEAAAKAHARGVPVIVLKAGVSEMGRRIALSHTGSMSGASELYDTFFERLGVVRAGSFTELLEVAKLLTMGPVPKGNRLSIETCSGTDSGYCADLADRYGVALPQPSPAVQHALREVIPAIATPANPLDVTMVQWNDRAAQATSLITLLREPTDAAALVINYPTNSEGSTYDPAIEAMIDVRASTDLPCYVITNLPEGAPRRVRDTMAKHGVVTLQGIEDAFAAFGRAARYAARRDALAAQGGVESRLILGDGGGDAQAADEWTSKASLRRAGVTLPDGRRVADAEAAVQAAEALGYPVVLKGCGARLLHKTEAGAVALGLDNADAVRAAARAMATVPGLEGFIVERMVKGAVAELIVGARRDPLFGMTLTLGAGGVLTELLRDVQNLILPVRETDVRDALHRLRAWPLLDGFRGRPKGDVDAVVAAVIAIAASLERDAKRVVELDVNPLMVLPRGQGAVAVDALLVTQGGGT